MQAEFDGVDVAGVALLHRDRLPGRAVPHLIPTVVIVYYSA